MAQNAAPQNFLNAGHFYSNLAKPIEIDLSFIVDSTNGNGLGIRSLKSNGYVKNVYMHTSSTPATGNPNPAAGYALVQLQGNFNRYIGGFSGFVTPVTGSIKIDNGATLTIGNPYIITTLGNATAAQWTTVGVPAGVTPAVGVSFIAIATGAGSGNTSTSRVSTPTTSGITNIEVIGDPNQSIANTNVAANGGAWLLVQFMSPTVAVTSGTSGNAVTLNAGTTLEATGGGTVATTMAPTAPANNSVCGMTIKLDGSSVSVDGL